MAFASTHCLPEGITKKANTRNKFYGTVLHLKSNKKCFISQIESAFIF